ncbi:HNH endonuclease signature motif containing protein, partial [Frankia sp. CcWB2]
DTSPGGDGPTDNGHHNDPDSQDGAGGTDSRSGTDNRDGVPGPGGDPADRRGLWLTDLPGGITRISGTLDAEAAALLRSALDPLAGPRPGDDGAADPRSPARRRADAFVELFHRVLGAGVLPVTGGVRPHLTVTVPWAALLGHGGPPASTGWGQPLPAGVLRRLACDASVGRVLFDAASVPLDVGRAYRTAPADLRRAVIARDVCCAYPGCDRPSSWCEIHHVRHWIDGGETSLDNLVLLCGYHHRFVHHQGWTVRLGPDRRPEFLPPPWIDPARKPRRNPYSRHTADLLHTAPGG